MQRTLRTQLNKTFGQGMTEYIIIVALIAVAAIPVFRMFGQTAQHQVAALSAELSGQDGEDSIERAQSRATNASTEANRNRHLGNYAGGSAGVGR